MMSMRKHIPDNLIRLRSFLIISLLSLFLLNCTKSNYKWLYYDETSCADKWAYDINNEKLKDNVTSYLQSKGIKVLEIEIYSDGITETCTACTCKTGRRIKCKVKKGEEDNMKSEGFY